MRLLLARDREQRQQEARQLMGEDLAQLKLEWEEQSAQMARVTMGQDKKGARMAVGEIMNKGSLWTTARTRTMLASSSRRRAPG